MPLASTELPTSTAYVSAPFSYGTSSSALYETPLSDHMGVPMSSYHDESPLYGSRDLANSTVRSLSPRTAVARLSETLVTAPTALSPDRLVEPAVYGWQPGVEYRPRIATAEDLAPSTLSSALRAAVPSYVEIFWERVAPVCGIVHRPSLEAAVTDSKQRDVLTCAMAAVAAQHLDTAEDRVNANHLHAYAAYHAKTVSCISYKQIGRNSDQTNSMQPLNLGRQQSCNQSTFASTTPDIEVASKVPTLRRLNFNNFTRWSVAPEFILTLCSSLFSSASPTIRPGFSALCFVLNLHHHLGPGRRGIISDLIMGISRTACPIRFLACVLLFDQLALTILFFAFV